MSEQKKFRVAIVGCGRMGRLHSRRLIDDGRASVVCVHDPLPEAAASLVQDVVPATRIANTFDELLRADDVDAAIICTPTTAHYEQVLACHARGWHILCEKPLAENRDRTRQLIEVARGGSTVCMLGYQRRYSATFRTLRREIRSGKWGAVRAFVAHNVEHWQQTIAGTWRDDPTINIGGFVGDAGNHKLDQVHYLTGLRVSEVQARSLYCGSNVPIQTSVSGIFNNGALLAMDFIGNAQYLGEDFHVHCERADLSIRDKTMWIARDNRVEQTTDLEPESNPVIEFLNVLDGKSENIAPFEIALPVWDLLAAIMKSSETGANVRV